jgi:hypothetical protein
LSKKRGLNEYTANYARRRKVEGIIKDKEYDDFCKRYGENMRKAFRSRIERPTRRFRLIYWKPVEEFDVEDTQ